MSLLSVGSLPVDALDNPITVPVIEEGSGYKSFDRLI